MYAAILYRSGSPPRDRHRGRYGWYGGEWILAKRELAAGTYGFDDVRIGDFFRTGECVVTAAQINEFAALTGDRFEIHMDDSAARAHGFPGRVAHGLLVLSLVDGLKNQSEARFRSVASLNWDWTFRAPILIGDRIGALVTIAGKRQTKDPERGILTLDFAVHTGDAGRMQTGTNLLMVYR